MAGKEKFTNHFIQNLASIGKGTEIDDSNKELSSAVDAEQETIRTAAQQDDDLEAIFSMCRNGKVETVIEVLPLASLFCIQY